MIAEQDVLPMVRRANEVAGPPQGCWTYDDYARIPDDGRRYEIIDGVLYMAPSPSEPHQGAINFFIIHLMTHIYFTGLGRVYAAPFDVQLAPRVVVQPDIVVVLKENLGIVTHARIVGAPDLVVEIASPGTSGYDRRQKQDAYARAGVREYWHADPINRTIEPLSLVGGAYESLGVFRGKALLPTAVIPGLPVPVEQFFDVPAA